jgi:signal transduction histidine kinase
MTLGDSPAWSSGRARGTTPGDSPAWSSGRAVVWGAVGVFASLAAVGVVLGRSQPDPPPVALAVSVAVAATAVSVLLARRRAPLLLYAAACAAGIAVICDARSSNVGWLAVTLIGGWCSLVGGRRAGLAYWAGANALFAAEWLWIRPDPGWSAWLAATTLTFCLGLLIRHQFDLVEQLRAAQAGLAEQARAQERNRIARDLHDVIAHTLTVSLLHVMSARLAVEHDPADAARSLAEAERLGRESLAEVRTAVGMLREDRDVSRFAPLPGVDGLPGLVERFKSAGADVTLSVDGDPARLPATVGLALFRIVQEALTNVIKHAAGSSATVRLVVDPAGATLSVHSLGPPGDGSGVGVMSMRERAESVGGSCEAGPGSPGWLVRASFPLGGPAAVTAPEVPA